MITNDYGIKTDDVYRDFYYELSKEFNIPHHIIKAICNSSFMYIRDHMKINDNDDREIALPYFGRFKLRNNYNKKNKNGIKNK